MSDPIIAAADEVKDQPPSRVSELDPGEICCSPNAT